MSKRTRQYIGILAALAAYYLVHEGAHLLYALLTGSLFLNDKLYGKTIAALDLEAYIW